MRDLFKEVFETIGEFAILLGCILLFAISIFSFIWLGVYGIGNAIEYLAKEKCSPEQIIKIEQCIGDGYCLATDTAGRQVWRYRPAIGRTCLVRIPIGSSRSSRSSRNNTATNNQEGE